MTRIGNHILDLDDIKHVLFDKTNYLYLIITKSNHHITNVPFTTDEYDHLLAELGVAEEFDHTDVVFVDGHFVTEPHHD